MGRNREPDEKKALRGTLRPCRKAATLPAGASGGVNLSPPSWLGKEQRKMFKAAASVLTAWGILQEADAGVITQYVVALSRFVEAERHIMEEGMMVEVEVRDKKGNVHCVTTVNPWYQISQDQQQLSVKLQQQLGFSPVARAKILSMIGKKDEERDDFSEFDQ